MFSGTGKINRERNCIFVVLTPACSRESSVYSNYWALKAEPIYERLIMKYSTIVEKVILCFLTLLIKNMLRAVFGTGSFLILLRWNSEPKKSENADSIDHDTGEIKSRVTGCRIFVKAHFSSRATFELEMLVLYDTLVRYACFAAVIAVRPYRWQWICLLSALWV